MSPPVQRGLPTVGPDVIRGPRRRAQDRPAWRPPQLGRKTITRTYDARGEEVTQRRDYDVLGQRTDATPPRHAPPTRSLAEWRAFERDWAATR